MEIEGNLDSKTVENSENVDNERGKDKSKDAGDKLGIGSKRHRKRKRNYFNQIREQMEFYFGDANLTKDRFLKQLIDKDPYVPLSVFLTFNKMKTLAKNVDEIAKSLTNSQLVELDDSQQKVRRKTALPTERNVDDRTLYVESIPPTADHDWLKENFSRFGKVTYVSLPKYAKSKKIKEFGFVEFDKQESLEKAIKSFKEVNGVLNMEEIEPSQLKSVVTYIKEHSDEQNEKCDISSAEKQQSLQKKRKAVDEKCHITPKKIKTDHDSFTVSSATDNDSQAEGSSSSSKESPAAETKTDELNSKKRRRKKRKSKLLATKTEDGRNNDEAFYNLKILPKLNWKRLRNKYLNLQREKISELKRKAWKVAQHNREHLIDGKETNGSTPMTPTKKPKRNGSKLHKINMNFYGAGDSEINESSTITKIKESKSNPALERAPLFRYEPGLIVEIAFLEPCLEVKEFKADMRQYTTVKYIDVKEGAMNAYIRLESATAAEDFIKQVSCANYKCKLLIGESESEYWRKIETDREKKLNKEVKVPQRRGREKVKKHLAKHIRFGDEDEGE